jgi:hypothetical protein
MKTPKHLLSDSGRWIVTAEFIAPDGSVDTSEGEAIITVGPDETISEVTVTSHTINRHGSYRVVHVSRTVMRCEELTPTPGGFTGTLTVDRNMLFLKFRITASTVNGYQIMHRNGDVCYAHGTICNGDQPTRNWIATLNLIDD